MTVLFQNKKAYSYNKGFAYRRISIGESQNIRYDRMDYLVVLQERQTQCHPCHTKTTTSCSKCGIGLHVKCFVNYHTKA